MTDPTAIQARLTAIRDRVYAWVGEEFADGLSSVAPWPLPLVDRDGWVVGSITVHGPTYRFPPNGQRDRIGATVRAAAGRLSSSRLTS